jgi:hypothetical protein
MVVYGNSQRACPALCMRTVATQRLLRLLNTRNSASFRRASAGAHPLHPLGRCVPFSVLAALRAAIPRCGTRKLCQFHLVPAPAAGNGDPACMHQASLGGERGWCLRLNHSQPAGRRLPAGGPAVGAWRLAVRLHPGRPALEADPGNADGCGCASCHRRSLFLLRVLTRRNRHHWRSIGPDP